MINSTCPASYVTVDGRLVSCNAYMEFTKNNTEQKCPTCGFTRIIVKKEIKPL